LETAVEEFVLGHDYEHVDVLSLIEEDHKPLKDLLHKMKDVYLSDDERIKAFHDFASLFLPHAEAEDASLYEFMKSKPEFLQDAFDGETEHMVAEQLCDDIRATADEHCLVGKIKVLAEVVEHHIYDEEHDVFPRLRNEINHHKLERLVRSYVMAETQAIEMVSQQ
jgi:hemerythrin superfamily protein